MAATTTTTTSSPSSSRVTVPFASMYVGPSARENLKNYRYHSTDLSLLSNHVLQPFWRAAVHALPLWLAPNLVTLIGLAHMAVAYALVAYHCPTTRLAAGDDEPPRWVWAFALYALFAYQTLDALDGKQARRTGSSSALGELFDHGCDAITTSLLSLVSATALQLTPLHALVQLMCLLVPFYLAQWEEYHTGEMFLGYVGVTEGQVIGMGMLATTAAFGPRFWTDTLLDAPLLGPTPLGDLMFYALLVPALVTTATYFTSPFRNHPELGVVQPALLLAPVAASVVAVVVWAACSPPPGVHAAHQHAFQIGVGMLFANFVGKVVVARVVQAPYRPVQYVLWPLLFGAANAAVLRVVDDEHYVYFFLAWSLLTYAHFALSVVQILCDYLNVDCLTIDYDKARRTYAEMHAKNNK